MEVLEEEPPLSGGEEQKQPKIPSNLAENKSSSSTMEFEGLPAPPSLTNLGTQGSPEEKILALKNLLEKYALAADFKWSLFVTACHSYRFDSCLRPFPPMYITNECKDIDALRDGVQKVPPFPVLFRQLHEPRIYEKSAATIDLLYWVLIRLKDPCIRSVKKECYESVLARVQSELPAARPNLIFQVVSVNQSPSEAKWRTASQGHSTLYAYHGSRLENFHSIIHYGLQQSMCKKWLYGKGIYLSSELGMSLAYSPIGYAWGGSVLGSDLSCVALCELIDHPDVKRGDSGDNGDEVLTDSIGGKVPNKYYLVINSDLVRIRYLLVYSREFSSSRKKHGRGMIAWFGRHKLLTFVLGYVVLLASVGLSHNKYVEKYCRLLIQKVGF